MIFIDTGYLVALAVRSDGLHQRARAWSMRARGPFHTTEYVLVEFVNRASQPRHRQRAHEMLETLQVKSRVRILPASDVLFRAALDMHRARRDKAWSLTDCTSFLTMTAHDCREALTHDQHFEQAGFSALLRFEPPTNGMPPSN